MKNISSSLNLRLTAYAAAGVAAAAPALSHSAKADIVYSGPLTINVPQTSAGIYFNFLTGTTSLTSTGFAGYDFNPYLGTGLSFFFNGTATTGNAGLATATGSTGVYQVLLPGAVIGSTGLYTTSAGATNMANYRAGESGGYLGLHFTNETTGATNYGWVQLNTTAGTNPANGYPATVLGYAFDNTGASILAGQIIAVPEPTTNAALGLGAMALGAMGLRRMRKARQTAA